MNYFYVYVLHSEKDGRFYTGYSSDLKKRIEDHNKGRVNSTKNRRPLKLIYFEGCLNQQDATKREKYLKTAWGKRYIKTDWETISQGKPIIFGGRFPIICMVLWGLNNRKQMSSQ